MIVEPIQVEAASSAVRELAHAGHSGLVAPQRKAGVLRRLRAGARRLPLPCSQIDSYRPRMHLDIPI